MSAFNFHWAGPNDIVHKTDARYDVLEGITSSYQFFMLAFYHRSGALCASVPASNGTVLVPRPRRTAGAATASALPRRHRVLRDQQHRPAEEDQMK